jgi:hypothetical protein
MKTTSYTKLPNTKRLKEILLSQSALDIIMKDEVNAWLRLSSFYKNYFDGIDMVKIDNGAGDNMYILFSKDGAIIKGFDHNSILSPYANDKGEITKGIYDSVPIELMELLKDESIEVNDVTFCVWISKNDSNWKKGNIIVPEDYKENDDGERFLLGYIFDDADSWLDWAEYHYEEEILSECVKAIYEHKDITREIIEKINPKRDVDAVIKELKMVGYII